MISLLRFFLLLRRQVKSFWSHSIRRQLVWSFGVAALLTMLGFSYLLYTHQRSFLYGAATDRATGLAHALAASSASWVLADDEAGLQEVLEGFSDTPDLKFAFVLSTRGEVLASTNARQIGRYVSDEISRSLLASPAEPRILINQPALIDVALPIMVSNRHIGWARVELTQESANTNLRLLGFAGVGFTVLAIIISSLVAVWLGHRLTRRLYHLRRVAESVEKGQRDVRFSVMVEDEVGALAHAFNRMLTALEGSERGLERLNRAYAAWTECSNVIVRERDEQVLLEHICQILAQQVPFKLVWVGRVDAAGWIQVVAASDPEAEYLRQLHISVDASRPEGQATLSVAMREGMPKIHNTFMEDKSVAWHEAIRLAGFRSLGVFPLMRGGRCFGAISVYSEESNYFSPDLITLMHGLAHDVSFALDNFDREQQRREAVAELALAASVFEHSKEGILVTDASNRIISVNRSFTEITGYSAGEALGRDPSMLRSGREDIDFYRKMWKSIATTDSWQGEIWNKRKSGEIYPEFLTIICVRDESGAVANHIAIFGDISERKLAEARIQQLAHYDVLTGLPNRALFNDRLEQAIIHAQRNQSKVSLLFLDLDRFKQINDTLGHGAGDQLLQMVAQRLMECIREQDTVSRQGGDEFIAVLPGTDVIGAEMVAGKMLHAIIQPYVIEGHDLRISSSIGIAVYPDHAQDADSLIKFADVAMYQAKEGGRNKYLRFDAGMNASAYERLKLESSLRVAVEHQELRLYYQPQVDLSDGRIIGCEALLRWQHPEIGMVSPASFIPLAEETGLIIQISDWVLEEAMRQSRAWREAGLPEVTISVNLSALQFRQRNLHEQVGALLKKYDVPPHVLDLELTEGILMQGVERTLAMLHELTEMGVGLSIDDFGTGYSSLSYLKRFPIQQLKIDQSFVRDVTTDSNDATMVRTIILMAHSLNLHVIAEGVETEKQAAFLRESGCERAQGYHFGRPMPAEAFARLLQGGRRYD